MVRPTILALAIALAACSEQPAPEHATAREATAPTADMLAAKQVTQRYFDLLRAGDAAGALALWSADSSTAKGGVSAFAAAARAQGRFEGRAGDPTQIRDDGDARYILVESGARAVSPRGKVSDLSGVVMLKRPSRGGGPWRIWGTDVRPRRCKQGEVAVGLGCVSS